MKMMQDELWLLCEVVGTVEIRSLMASSEVGVEAWMMLRWRTRAVIGRRVVAGTGC